VCDLKAKFKEWEEWLVGDDINSIRNQIYSMIWDSAVFQSINECRRYASMNEKNEIELNGTVHQFIDKCFFETQALAIRRILDKRKDVISLHRLVGDIENHSNLLTRGNILETHDYPYNYEQEKTRFTDEAFKNKPPEAKCVVMGQDYRKCVISEATHEFIDSLAGLDSSNRSPDDRIRPQIFKWLRQRLDECEEIATFATKFLAHSATPESRDYLKPKELDVTLEQILKAHKIICQTTIFISGRMGILSEGHSIGDVLPFLPCDQLFAHFDKAWASEEVIEKLSDSWHKYDMQTRNWQQWEWENEFNKFLES
jgi:hypothetical protein